MSHFNAEDLVAVEDCLEHCPNHFTLAYHTANRAHLILRRGDAQVPEGEDRVVVVALREIAGGHTSVLPMKMDFGGPEEHGPVEVQADGELQDGVESATEIMAESAAESAVENAVEDSTKDSAKDAVVASAKDSTKDAVVAESESKTKTKAKDKDKAKTKTKAKAK